MLTYHHHLSTLTPSELSALASFLTLPPRLICPTTGQPSELWLATQSRQLSSLPKPLRRPSNWLARLSIATNRALRLFPQPCAVLCSAHAALNPWLVRRVFLLLENEVTHHRLQRLHRAPVVGELVERLEGVRALWEKMDDDEEEEEGEEEQLGFQTRIASGCEACVVAVVGAQSGVLRDLRAVLVGRWHRRKQQQPVLLRMVEAWIGLLDREEAVEVERRSDKLAKAVKRVRRAAWKKRKGRKGGRGRGGRWSSSCLIPAGGGLAVGTTLLSTRREESCRVTMDTIDNTIDAYRRHDDDDDEQQEYPDNHEYEYDERMTQHLQDPSCQWYSTRSEASEQHPAFQEGLVELEASWEAESRLVESIAPSSLQVQSTHDHDGDHENEAVEDPSDDDPYDPSQWTDVTVHTGLVHQVPSFHCPPFVLSNNGSIVLAGSSVYSHTEAAIPHPSPVVETPRLGSRNYVRPRPPVPATSSYHSNQALSMLYAHTAAGPVAPAAYSPRSIHSYQLATSSRTRSSYRHHHDTSSTDSAKTTTNGSSSSATSLSPNDFQSALDKLSLSDDNPRNPSTFDGAIPEGTVHPDESISVVAAIQADEGYTRALKHRYNERPPGRLGFRSEDGIELGDDESVRVVPPAWQDVRETERRRQRESWKKERH